MKIVKLSILISLVALSSCSKKEDFGDNNLAPQIEFSTPDNPQRVTLLNDTVKVNWRYLINVFVIDEEDLEPVFMNGGDTIPFGQDELEFPIHYAPLPNNDSTYEFVISEAGTYYIDVSAEDSYGGVWYTSFGLYVVSNLGPQVRFQVENTGILDPLEITIDASETFDPDARWGGEVILYEYTINNNPSIETELSSITYIVSEPGNYSIRVRAMDNDGAWSGEQEEFITVNE